MQFNSIEFAVFLPIVFFLYWFVAHKDLKLQNSLLLVASYFFYGWWDWRFLSLIFISSSLDFIIARELGKEAKPRHRKNLLLLSLLLNLGLLGFFKYYNFFAENLADSFVLLGKPLDIARLNIILPVGISFYTFQTLSYTIDVYRRRISPTKDILSFFSFVSFFPQLVAGPIERASDLLPQFFKKRSFEYSKAVDGSKQILWGLFKKVVIADSIAPIVNNIFENHGAFNGSALLIGAFLFSFQIYGDFSGYSDIAIGTARLFGFKLKQNFAFPYFSRDISEFWRRWHISLTTWFRDYLYIPLGGSKTGTPKKVRNIFIIFAVSGLWHGASWNFLAWGLINAALFLPLMLLKKNRKHISIAGETDRITKVDILRILLTFVLVSLTWVVFRAKSLDVAIGFVTGIFSISIIKLPYGIGLNDTIHSILLISIFLIIEWKGRKNLYAIEGLMISSKKIFRHSFYWLLIIMVFLFSNDNSLFIYFQF